MRSTNKPYVFLSHSSVDKPFIERIDNDLRKCKIDTWLDTNSIPDGKPWMDEIFQNGISVCDAILTYYTDKAAASAMVEREVNSTILRQLKDNKVAFLPYADSEETRSKLRVDIQALQCRIWNESNYQEMLPSIIASIWSAYTERAVHTATLEEKSRRMEAELKIAEVEKVAKSSLFSPQEEKEFRYLFEQLSQMAMIDVGYLDLQNNSKDGNYDPILFSGQEIFIKGSNHAFPEDYSQAPFRPIDVLVHLVEGGSRGPEEYTFLETAYSVISETIPARSIKSTPVFRDGFNFEKFRSQLHIYSLIDIELTQSDFLGSLTTERRPIFSQKMYRLIYWARYYHLLDSRMS